MRPVLEKQRLARLQGRQLFRFVGAVAREQDVMVRALHHAYGIELHVAQLLDQRRDCGAAGLRARLGQMRSRQNECARLLVGDDERRGHGRVFKRNANSRR